MWAEHWAQPWMSLAPSRVCQEPLSSHASHTYEDINPAPSMAVPGPATLTPSLSALPSLGSPTP